MNSKNSIYIYIGRFETTLSFPFWLQRDYNYMYLLFDRDI